MKTNEIKDSQEYWDDFLETYRDRYFTRLMTDEEIKERNMSRATYRLKKETEVLKAGAIVQEACDDDDSCVELTTVEDLQDDDWDLKSNEVKEMTVAQIAAVLGHEVKIVKE